MKLIIFSDIHGNNHAFYAFLKSLPTQYEQYNLLFLGDFIGYYYGANEIISYCREHNISCILGNHDKYFLDILDGALSLEKHVEKYGHSYEIALDTISKENISFLRRLDKNKILTSANKKVYFCHGSPLDNLEGRIYPDTDLSQFNTAAKGFNYIVTGHTHHKMTRSYGSTIFLNPGSLGQQRDGKGCSYMILDLEKDAYSFHTVDYPIAALEEEIDKYDSGRKGLKEVLRRTR
jgi:putative phosphoesterase